MKKRNNTNLIFHVWWSTNEQFGFEPGISCLLGSCSRNNSNFGIGNSICKHGLKLCGSLPDYLGGAMITLCGSLLPDRAWRCCNFHDRFSSVRMNRTSRALVALLTELSRLHGIGALEKHLKVVGSY